MGQKQWLKMGTRAADLQQAVHYAFGIDIGFNQAWQLPSITHQLYWFDGHATHIYFDAPEDQKLSELFTAQLNDPQFLAAYPPKILAACDQALQTTDQLLAQLKPELANQQLFDLLEQENQLWTNFFPYAWSLWYIRLLEPIIRQVVSQQVEASELEETVRRLAFPTTVSPLSAAEIETLKLAQLIEAGEPAAKIQERAEQLADQYAWLLAYNFSDPPTKPEHFLEQAQDLVDQKVDLTARLTEQAADREANEQFFQEFLTQQTDPLVKAQLQVFHTAAYLRDKREEARDMMTLRFQAVYREIGRRLNLTLKEVTYLSTEEIQAGLTQELPEAQLKEQATQRFNGFIILHEEGRYRVVDNSSEYDSLTKELAVTEQVSVLKGQVAYKVDQPIQGVVKIVLTNQDVAKVNEGDILVSSMTKPDYIAAMKRAAGFVTDEGGLLSHAAIVAREMKKPCIIGTKIATQVLKDGDTVEVDAVKGTVSRI